MLLASLGAVLLAVFEVDQALMRSRRQSGAFALWTVVALVSSQLIGLLFVVAGAGATGFVTGWVIGTGVGTLGSLIVVRPIVRGGDEAGTHLAEALRIGLPAAAYATVLTSLTYVDRFVLSSFHGPGAAGRYQLAYTVGGVTVAALGAINLAWGPEVLRSFRNGNAFLAETTVDIALGMVVLVGAGVALAPVGVAILAPADYDRNAITVAACLLLPLGALQVLHYSRTHLLTWRGKLTALVPLSAGVAGVHLVGNLLLDREHPLSGPPIVALVSFSVLAIMLTWLSRGGGEGAACAAGGVGGDRSLAVPRPGRRLGHRGGCDGPRAAGAVRRRARPGRRDVSAAAPRALASLPRMTSDPTPRPELALGTANWAGSYGAPGREATVDEPVARSLAAAFLAAGHTLVDTAPTYGGAEELVGTVLDGAARVINKVPSSVMTEPDAPAAAVSSLRQSLARTRVARFAGVLLHDPGAATRRATTGRDVVAAVRDAELADRVGVSVYSPEEAYAAVDQLGADLVQLPCNVLDQRSWPPAASGTSRRQASRSTSGASS